MTGERSWSGVRSIAASLFLTTWMLAASIAHADRAPGLYTGLTMNVGGVARSYDLFIPTSYTGLTAIPLVVDLHGWSRSPAYQRSISGFDAVAQAEGFAVAWPAGLGPTVTGWNAGDPCSPVGLPAGPLPDDVGFMRALVAALEADIKVIPNRVYVTGHSCGAAMTQRLVCEASDLFAAASTFAWPEPRVACSPARPVSIWMTHGRQDTRIPYDGGYIDGNPSQPLMPSAHAGFAAWRDRNACVGTTPNVVENPGATSVCERYTSCAAGTQVGLCSVDAYFFPANHVPYWPSVTDGFNSQQRAWQFMSGFTLPSSVPASSWIGRGLLAALLGASGVIAMSRRRRAVRGRTEGHSRARS